MKLHKAKLAALAAAALFSLNAAGTAEAAAPEKQLSLIAEQAVAWNADFADSLRDGDSFAITDLDGNGRLELLILKSVRNPIPEANANGSNRQKGMALVASMPITLRPRGYEVSADGKRLEEIIFHYEDKIIPPNLTNINSGNAYYYADDKTRSYSISTLNRIEKLGFRMYKQVLSMKDGTMTVQTIGMEQGQYGLFDDIATAEAIIELHEDQYGKRIENQQAFNEYVEAYHAGCDPAQVRVSWISAEELRPALKSTDTLRSLLSESWKEFRFGLKDKPDVKNKKNKNK